MQVPPGIYLFCILLTGLCADFPSCILSDSIYWNSFIVSKEKFKNYAQFYHPKTTWFLFYFIFPNPSPLEEEPVAR